MSEQHNYSLDKQTANDLLNNVLDSCNIPPSPKTIESLILKRKLEKKPIVILMHIAFLFLIIAICTPLFFRGDSDFQIVSGSKNVVVSSHMLYDDCFVMTLSGGADYAGIHAKKDDGSIIYPDTYDPATGLVIFPYNGASLNIYIPTVNGECIQAVLHESK